MKPLMTSTAEDKIAEALLLLQPLAAPEPVHNGPAYWIKVPARDDGEFTVANSRTGFSKAYRASQAKP